MNTVFVLVPTYNRIDRLREFVALVDSQTYEQIILVVVEDGCTDGTHEYLKDSGVRGMIVLRGDGDLWWGGAINKGIDYLRSVVKDNDFVLIINDDVVFDVDYVEKLVDSSLKQSRAIIGSAQFYSDNGSLMMLGYQVNKKRLTIDTVRIASGEYADVDAVGGRGVLIPGQCFMQAGYINTKLFKHYLGDLDFTYRLKNMGFRVLVFEKVGVYVDREPSDSKLAKQGVLFKYLHSKSKSNLFHKMCLFFVFSSFKERLIFPLSYPVTKLRNLIGTKNN